MWNESGNVVSLSAIRRRQIRQRHEDVLALSRTMIAEAQCDCDLLFGSSADEIARLVTMVVTQLHDIGDPANAQYIDVLSDSDQEQLAGFAGAVAGDVLRECRANAPLVNRELMWGQCLVNARRLVTANGWLIANDLAV